MRKSDMAKTARSFQLMCTICSLYFGSIHFGKSRPIIVECRKQGPILWKSSLEGGNVVSACQCHFARNTPSINNYFFPPIVMVTRIKSVELGVSEFTFLTLVKRLKYNTFIIEATRTSSVTASLNNVSSHYDPDNPTGDSKKQRL